MGCFHFLAVVNCDPVNVCVPASVWTDVLSSGGYPGVASWGPSPIKLTDCASVPSGTLVHLLLLSQFSPRGFERIYALLADSIHRLPTPILISASEPRLAGPCTSPPGAAFSARLIFLPHPPGVPLLFPWPGMPSAPAHPAPPEATSWPPPAFTYPHVQCSPAPDALNLWDPPATSVCSHQGAWLSFLYTELCFLLVCVLPSPSSFLG